MPSGSHSESSQIGSSVVSRTENLTFDNANVYGDASSPIALTAALALGGYTNSDANTAAGTLTAGHGWGDGAHIVDVYDSATSKCIRFGVTGTVTTNAIVLEGGTAAEGSAGFQAAPWTTGVVAIQQQINVSIDGDLAAMVHIDLDVLGHLDFQDADSHSIRALTVQADEPDCWDSEETDNPYTGDPITKVRVTNGTTTAGTISIAVGQDSTP